MRHVIFGVLSLGGTLCEDFTKSYIAMAFAFAHAGIRTGSIHLDGNIYLADARNAVLSRFLSIPDATDLFWIDSDVGVIQPQKAVEFVQRPQDIIAGVYPKKREETDFPVGLCINRHEDGAVEFIEQDGLLLVTFAATGFMKMTRLACERLAGASGKYQAIDATGVVERYEVFEARVRDNADGTRTFWGEDNWMCDKWLQLGGEIWIDPSVNFTHQGTKKYSARLSDHLPKYLENAARL